MFRAVQALLLPTALSTATAPTAAGLHALQATWAIAARSAARLCTAVACSSGGGGGGSGGGSLAAPSSSSTQQLPELVAQTARRRMLSTSSAAAAAAEYKDLIAPDLGLATIQGLDETGFLVNNVQVEGSVMLSGDVFTLWGVRRFGDVTLESLSLLRLLKPVPDLLVLGCGRHMRQLPAELARQLHLMGVRVDVLDTTNAVATFNLLNEEGRKVVGALLPLGAEE